MIELGRMEKISNLREAWESEDGAFTPWLAKEENLELLGNTIGIDLELEAQEQNVGPFRADILCKDTVTNNWVLIENQIEKTDHTHLGQILTYGAGLEATTIVWIAKSFTEEHRATLDWLNEITNESFNFFGLEIELWQIGDSPIAPKFNIVCKPNGWIVGRRSGSVTGGTGTTPDQQLRLDYWTVFVEYLSQQDSNLKGGKPLPWSFYQISIGRSGFSLVSYLNLKKNTITIGLYLQGKNAMSYYNLIKLEKNAIEEELNTKLYWDESRQTTRYINLTKDANIRDRQNWTDQHEWLYENLKAFYATFAARVKNLDANDYQPEEDMEPPELVS